MESILVHSLPIQQVIKDIAKATEAEVEYDCREIILRLPDVLGEGFIRGMNFEGGLGVLHYDCRFFNDVDLRFTVDEIHPAKFLFVSEGRLEHSFLNDTTIHSIDRYQSAMVASNDVHGHVLRFHAGERIGVFSLEIDRRVFLPEIECELETMSPSLRAMFLDVEAEQVFYHSGDYSLAMQEIINRWEAFDGRGVSRKLFLQSRAFDMLTQQILQYEDDMSMGEHRTLLRQSEIDMVNRAISQIDLHLSELGTITELAHHVGTNANKLQEGFRILKGTTVNTYIQDTRLRQAAELLRVGELSIANIVEQVGLNSNSYFSKVFKEYYGLTPSEYRKALKAKV